MEVQSVHAAWADFPEHIHTS